jgi:hypothetical protein
MRYWYIYLALALLGAFRPISGADFPRARRVPYQIGR